jgi:CspA family cold shock protein
MELHVPTGKVKFFDEAKGFGFATRDDGGDVFLPGRAVPQGEPALKGGERIDMDVVSGAKGEEALKVRRIEAPIELAGARRAPDELHGMIEDMVKVLETLVQRDLRRGKHPDRDKARKVAQLLHAVARELEA